mgnify:CR=1 FL=1
MKLPYIEAGEIVTTHGVRGEVKVLSWLDSPEMLCEFDRCRIRQGIRHGFRSGAEDLQSGQAPGR